jgi:hypothetical protein
MEPMASRWTDDRLDDFKHQVNDLGRRMDAGFADLRAELREHRRDMDKRFDKIDEKFLNVGEEVRATQRMVIALHATITRLSVTLLAVVAGLVVTRLA